jgi:mono/diheme cytochrome c family protein
MPRGGQVSRRRTIAVGLCLIVPSVAAAAPAPFSPHQVEFFETQVRPILAGTCQKCHGVQKQKGGLRLDSRDSLLKGGDSGAAVVPGKPDASPMIDAVNYRRLEMPPTGKLNQREIAALVEWVKMGAPWPQEQPSAAASRRSDFTITDEDRHYWALLPVGNPQPPKVSRKEWVANPIDAFVLARLEEKGLAPNPPADPRTLIRRLFFDLIGLPPAPEEIDAFVADHSPRAYERLVDDLLSRTQYGERWGRHWLDVTRFAQTNGYERDAEKPESWRYRDYVIQAFNDDKPYDRFVTEQLAGDELAEVTNESIIATGFYRLGIWDDEPDNQQAAAWDEIDETVRTTGAAFLGLTLGCARCHNHIFDPISQEDYYQLAAIFRNVEPYGVPVSATHMAANRDGIFTPLTSPKEYAVWHARQADVARQLKEVKSRLAALRKAVVTRLQTKHKTEARPTKVEIEQDLTSAERTEKSQLESERTRLEKALKTVPFPRALSVRECGLPLQETRVLIRGNVATPGKRVEPRLLTVLGGKKLEAIPVSMGGSNPRQGSVRSLLAGLGVKPTLGLRRQLAEWIADKQNPLTPRVMMNRVWQEHFGRGIVRSADNFGRAGTPPTHPELLAWLARDFIDGGWRLKRMQKRIVLSNAYQMSSAENNAHADAVDADNDLFWRQNLHRLDAEAIRDSMLAVSGRLNLTMGGRGIFPKLSPEVLATQSRPGLGWDQESSPAEESRRSVYIYLKRTLMVPFFEAFDYTNTAESVGTRPITTVAPQALLLLNSEFANEQAAALAERVRRDAGSNSSKQIDRLFRLALGRSPTQKESTIAAQLLGRPHGAGPDRLRSLCLVVLNLNEFVYVD